MLLKMIFPCKPIWCCPNASWKSAVMFLYPWMVFQMSGELEFPCVGASTSVNVTGEVCRTRLIRYDCQGRNDERTLVGWHWALRFAMPFELVACRLGGWKILSFRPQKLRRGIWCLLTVYCRSSDLLKFELRLKSWTLRQCWEWRPGVGSVWGEILAAKIPKKRLESSVEVTKSPFYR